MQSQSGLDQPHRYASEEDARRERSIRLAMLEFGIDRARAERLQDESDRDTANAIENAKPFKALLDSIVGTGR